ncbi:Gfo/Idh/MocA family oxidoreductase [Gymnodinialimonas sp. 2305UL16-5]|uniref:Gfo/Idh/MocA family protein n=1 Tax=Gymnodinialimonas mytili TaxID=3126503 RepID=UPI0030A5135F
MSGGAPYRVACVGAGYFSQFHYGSWARLDRAELVASCNRDLAKAQATGLPAYDDLPTMLHEQRPDLLDIILPPVAHADTIRIALAHDLKWIICQKPFCQNLDEARAITAEAAAAGATLVVHENFRFQPWFRAIKRAVDDELIGQVMQATFRLRPGDGQGPDAYLDRQPYFQTMPRFLVHETAMHYVDTFRFILGEPTAIYADLRRVNPVIAGEDAGYILADHPGGARTLIDGNRNLDHAAANLRCTMGEALIEGVAGTLTLKGDGSVWLRSFGDQEPERLLPPNQAETFGGDCVHALQDHVLSAMAGERDPENRAADYLRILEIEEAIYASAESGQKIALSPYLSRGGPHS